MGSADVCWYLLQLSSPVDVLAVGKGHRAGCFVVGVRPGPLKPALLAMWRKLPSQAVPLVTLSKVTRPHDMSCAITRVANISEERERDPDSRGLEALTSQGGSLRKALEAGVLNGLQVFG